MITPQRFSPFAEMLLMGYLDTHTRSREFREEHGSPLTAMAKAHTLRSYVQAAVLRTEGLQLSSRFVEFGRVEIIDATAGDRFVLRSQRNLAFEVRQESLLGSDFDVETEVFLLVYAFDTDGVTLARAEAMMRPPSKRILAAGDPRMIGYWSFADLDAGSFDQGADGDAFEDLGDLDVDDERDFGA